MKPTYMHITSGRSITRDLLQYSVLVTASSGCVANSRQCAEWTTLHTRCICVKTKFRAELTAYFRITRISKSPCRFILGFLFCYKSVQNLLRNYALLQLLQTLNLLDTSSNPRIAAMFLATDLHIIMPTQHKSMYTV
jgi:hypothetical protein